MTYRLRCRTDRLRFYPRCVSDTTYFDCPSRIHRGYTVSIQIQGRRCPCKNGSRFFPPSQHYQKHTKTIQSEARDKRRAQGKVERQGRVFRARSTKDDKPADDVEIGSPKPSQAEESRAQCRACSNEQCLHRKGCRSSNRCRDPSLRGH